MDKYFLWFAFYLTKREFLGENYKSVTAEVVFFYLGWCQIPPGYLQIKFLHI
jgi:hypothetical protein